MCLGIPGEIRGVYETDCLHEAKVDFGGVSRDGCLGDVPEALGTLDRLKQIGALEEET